MGIVRDLVIETSEVETIKDEVLIDLAKILIPLGGEEPGYPLGEGELGSMISNTREGRGSWKRIG